MHISSSFLVKTSSANQICTPEDGQLREEHVVYVFAVKRRREERKSILKAIGYNI
jgi:hypothetical protein